MGTNRSSDKDNILSQLTSKIVKKVSKARQDAIREFTRDFFLTVPVEDLRQRSIEELVAQTSLVWDFIQEFDAKAPKIVIVNPDSVRDNWQSGHTVVMVLQSDMPFLTDSARMEFSRNEIGVHAVQSVVQLATRDSKGKLKKRVRRNFDDKAARLASKQTIEAALYFEIDRQALTSERLLGLQESLADVLEDLRVVIDDFVNMKARAMELVQELELTPPPLPEEEVTEGKVFLQWLLQHNFTFMGYKEYNLTKKRGKPFIDSLSDRALGIVKRKGKSNLDRYLDQLPPNAQKFVVQPRLLSFAKSGTLSRVHRPAYPDYVAIRRFNKKGEVIGERGFLGLYTLPVYTEPTRDIPVLRLKVQEIMRRSGLHPASHDGKELARVLETYPRDELFQTDTDDLFATATRIAQIKERHQTKVSVRRDHYSKFVTCFVYVPREAYNTELREKIQRILCRTFQALNAEFNTYFGESVLVRTQFTLRTDPDKDLSYDLEALEQEIAQVTRSWQEELSAALIAEHGEEQGLEISSRFRNGFPSSYRDNFSAAAAVADIRHLESIDTGQPLAMQFYQNPGEEANVAHFSLFRAVSPVPLSDVIPVLENMGLNVIGEHPYRITDRSGAIFWKHDFNLTYNRPNTCKASEVSERFAEAFEQVWNGVAGNDCFNRLVLAADLDWREVMLVRACARYLKQIKLGLSREFMTDTFLNNIDYTVLAVDYFKTKFDPHSGLSAKQRDTRLADIETRCLALLDSVDSLSEDLVLRRYLELCKAMLRTNYFQKDQQGEPKVYMSFKFAPRLIPAVPLPVPMFEIFVYAEQVEGVHLRGGKVARGGLRWSDRVEDYRTEVLGLVKAQQVKNAVIVPVGAKGGFIAKRASAISDRSAFREEGISSYKTFISGLLDISDNLKQEKVVPPPDVVRHDEDDPYLVVAADKGTATFSDISNALAKDYGFWLGDAFASGGSQGYDHKGMGITARGGWVGVQRHFRERALNIQETDFTVVGIGDMGGDVFGNGMLLSEHIKLVAAFNHLHIFIDPDPDPAKSFAERQRLFKASQSGWSEYDEDLISKGGGVFQRTAKSIPISAEMKKRFGIKDAKLTPNALLQTILKSKVDLIWNGGIGTYVKATSESDEDVGDRANDAIRVNGIDVQAQVIGEGGNLGATQLGRIEFALHGGAINTDFIDNAAGVDCSDHEVNIKILLDTLVDAEKLTVKQRNRILSTMTAEVADLVLLNNYRQVQAISIAERAALTKVSNQRRFMSDLVAQGKLNRELEFLPGEEELVERIKAGKGLTRPELSVLTSYAKADLKERLVDTTVSADSYLSRVIETAFPPYLRKRFKDEIYAHQLRREIIATQLANEVVNTLGITFAWRTQDFTGASLGEVVAAFVMARDIFGLQEVWESVEDLDNQVPAKLQLEMLTEIVRLMQQAVRWFLKQRGDGVDVAETIARYQSGVASLRELIPGTDVKDRQAGWQEMEHKLTKANVPAELATQVAITRMIFFALDIAEVSEATGTGIERVYRAFVLVSSELNLDQFREQINKIDIHNHWHQMARDTFRDELDAQTRALTQSLVERKTEEPGDIDEAMAQWLDIYEGSLRRWRSLQTEFQRGGDPDLALYSVAMRELATLAKASSGS